MRLDWIDIVIGVVCIVLAGMLVGWLLPTIGLSGGIWGIVSTALAALIGIIAWFAIRPMIKR